MSAAARLNPLMPSSAKVRLGPDGVLAVRMAMTDIGTGTYTILTQIAGEMLGLPPERVRVEMGDTDFPSAAGSGGSFGAGIGGLGALRRLRRPCAPSLLEAGDLNPDGAVFADGAVTSGNRIGGARRPRRRRRLEAEGEIKPGDDEAEVLAVLATARTSPRSASMPTPARSALRRMLGVFTGGRILNAEDRPQPGDRRHDLRRRRGADGGCGGRSAATATSSTTTWPSTTCRSTPTFRRSTRCSCRNSTTRRTRSRARASASSASAGPARPSPTPIYNATGIRVRDYPLTLDKVLKGFEEQEGQAQRRT